MPRESQTDKQDRKCYETGWIAGYLRGQLDMVNLTNKVDLLQLLADHQLEPSILWNKANKAWKRRDGF